MSPKAFICKENCERAKQPSGGGGEGLGGGVSLSEQITFCILSPKKQFLMHYFGQRLLECNFHQIARGQDDNIVTMKVPKYKNIVLKNKFRPDLLTI